MIEMNVHVLENTATTVDIQIVVVDAGGGAGIEQVTVLDQHGAEVDARIPPEPCPESFVFDVTGIPHTRFPIEIVTRECDDGPETLSGPIPILPGGSEGIGVTLPCLPSFCVENPRCTAAQSEVIRLRNRVNYLCTELAHIKELRRTKLAAALTLFIAGVVLVAVGAVLTAIPFVQGVGVALAILGAVLIGAAMALFGSAHEDAKRMRNKTEEIRNSQADFGDAAQNVIEDCCAGCIVADLTPPACGHL